MDNMDNMHADHTERCIALLGQIYMRALDLEADDRTYDFADGLKREVCGMLEELHISDTTATYLLALWYATARGLNETEFNELLAIYKDKG